MESTGELCLPSSPAPSEAPISCPLPSRPSSSSPRRDPFTQQPSRAARGCGPFAPTSFLNSHASPTSSFHQTFPASPQLPAQPRISPPCHAAAAGPHPTAALRQTRQRHKPQSNLTEDPIRPGLEGSRNYTPTAPLAAALAEPPGKKKIT